MQQHLHQTHIQDALPHAADLFADARTAYRAFMAKRVARRALRDFYSPQTLAGLSDFEKDIFADVIRERMLALSNKSIDRAAVNIRYGMKILQMIGRDADDHFVSDIRTRLVDNAARRLRTTRHVSAAFNGVAQLSYTLDDMGHGLDAGRAKTLSGAVLRRVNALTKSRKSGTHISTLHQAVVTSQRVLETLDQKASDADNARLAGNVEKHILRGIKTAETHSDIRQLVTIGRETLNRLGSDIDASLRAEIYVAVLKRALGDIEGDKHAVSADNIQTLTKETLIASGVSQADASCAMLLFPRARFKAEMAQMRARLTP